MPLTMSFIWRRWMTMRVCGRCLLGALRIILKVPLRLRLLLLLLLLTMLLLLLLLLVLMMMLLPHNY
jgi:hypothetical protein